MKTKMTNAVIPAKARIHLEVVRIDYGRNHAQPFCLSFAALGERSYANESKID
jgi:hypothetical protein